MPPKIGSYAQSLIRRARYPLRRLARARNILRKGIRRWFSIRKAKRIAYKKGLRYGGIKNISKFLYK